MICNIFSRETSEVLVLIVRAGTGTRVLLLYFELQEFRRQGAENGYQTTRSSEIEKATKDKSSNGSARQNFYQIFVQSTWYSLLRNGLSTLVT